MKDREKQIEEMAKDLKENLRLCAGVKLLDHQVETIAYELSCKMGDNVVLSREEYDNAIKDRCELKAKINEMYTWEQMEKYRKETAREILQEAKVHFDEMNGDRETFENWLCKRYGVDLGG